MGSCSRRSRAGDKMLSDDFLRRLDALSLHMKTPAGGSSGGLRRSKALGSSVEFSDFREYVPGDDLRRLDWNAYARFDRLFLKLFMEEQEQRVHLVLDMSASMGFGEPSKADCAKRLTEALCYLALGGSDTVTLYALAEGGEKHTRTLHGRHSYPAAVEFLEGLSPKGQISLNELLPRLPLNQGRGVTVLISDLLCEDGYQRGLQSLLYHKQELSLLQLWSQEEWEPALEDMTELFDSETGQRLTVKGGYDLLKRYRDNAGRYVNEVRDFCLKHGVLSGFTIPEKDFERQMLHDLSRLGLIG